MKTSIKSVAVITLLLIACALSSCEKHDGIYYSKAKCTAELNGQTFIDQSPLITGPDATTTPSFSTAETHAEFKSYLSPERGKSPVYAVEIRLFSDNPWDYLYTAQTIKQLEIDYPNDEPTASYYASYCKDNNISYARILSFSTYQSEIISNGTFKITSYNKETGECSGTFSLVFGEGTLNGEFSGLQTN